MQGERILTAWGATATTGKLLTGGYVDSDVPALDVAGGTPVVGAICVKGINQIGLSFVPTAWGGFTTIEYLLMLSNDGTRFGPLPTETAAAGSVVAADAFFQITGVTPLGSGAAKVMLHPIGSFGWMKLMLKFTGGAAPTVLVKACLGAGR